MNEKNDTDGLLKDISLYSFDQLVEEIFNRCEDCVVITSRFEDKDDPIIRSTSKRGSIPALGMLRIAEQIYMQEVFEEEDD